MTEKINNKYFTKIREEMIDIGIELNKIESLSGILINCIRESENLKSWDAENLSLVLSHRIYETKQKINAIEILMGI